MTQPLKDLKVLDFTRYLSGPYCTLILADMGATVLKVERHPGGDDARHLPPFVHGQSYPFAEVNRNKQSIAVDLSTSDGRSLVRDLVSGYDVIVENFRPGTMAKWGLDYETLSAEHSDLVYCSISGFGQTGPYRSRAGFDIIAQGLAGFLRMNGHPGDEPSKVGIAMTDLIAGATAAHGVLGAVIHRLMGHGGQFIDVALLDAGIALTMFEAGKYFGAGEMPEPAGSRHRMIAPYQAYRTQDGYITLGGNNPRLWQRLCAEVLERPEWLVDERFLDLDSRMSNVDELQLEIEAILLSAPTEEWVRRLDSAGVPGAAVLGYDQALADAQVLARDMVLEQVHPTMGTIRTLGFPIKFSQSPGVVRMAAPLLGEHTEVVAQELGLSADRIAELVDRGVLAVGRVRDD